MASEIIYGDEHRIFLQALMCRGIVDYSEILKILESICQRCNFEFPTDKSAQTKMIVRLVERVNRQIESLGLMIIKIIDEDHKAKITHFGLFNTLDRDGESTQLNKKAMVDYNPGELEYIKVFVEKLMMEDEKEVDGITALNLCKFVQCRLMKTPEAEVVLQKLVDDRWLKKTTEQNFRLSARFIMEMNHYLKENFPDEVGTCGLCKKIVIRSKDCQCGIKYHLYCLAAGGPKESQRCGTCEFKIELPNDPAPPLASQKRGRRV